MRGIAWYTPVGMVGGTSVTPVGMVGVPVLHPWVMRGVAHSTPVGHERGSP